MDVVSKAFTEKAAPLLGSIRDKTCLVGRDERYDQTEEIA